MWSLAPGSCGCCAPLVGQGFRRQQGQIPWWPPPPPREAGLFPELSASRCGWASRGLVSSWPAGLGRGKAGGDPHPLPLPLCRRGRGTVFPPSEDAGAFVPLRWGCRPRGCLRVFCVLVLSGQGNGRRPVRSRSARALELPCLGFPTVWGECPELGLQCQPAGGGAPVDEDEYGGGFMASQPTWPPRDKGAQEGTQAGRGSGASSAPSGHWVPEQDPRFL